MTKAEELKLLDQIEELINSADEDSYIRMTFDGICAVCLENIRADFGNCPVRDLDELRQQYSAEVIRHDETKHDLAMLRTRCDSEIRMHDETKRMLAESQKALQESMENEDEWSKQASAVSEECDNIWQENQALEAEVRKLKAEIVRMRMERMTEDDISELYDKTKGAWAK